MSAVENPNKFFAPCPIISLITNKEEFDMNNENIGEQISMLAQLLEEANKTSKDYDAASDTFGKCEWVDINGDSRCNSPWSQFQCEQAGGTFTLGESCDDEQE